MMLARPITKAKKIDIQVRRCCLTKRTSSSDLKWCFTNSLNSWLTENAILNVLPIGSSRSEYLYGQYFCCLFASNQFSFLSATQIYSFPFTKMISGLNHLDSSAPITNVPSVQKGIITRYFCLIRVSMRDNNSAIYPKPSLWNQSSYKSFLKKTIFFPPYCTMPMPFFSSSLLLLNTSARDFALPSYFTMALMISFSVFLNVIDNMYICSLTYIYMMINMYMIWRFYIHVILFMYRKSRFRIHINILSQLIFFPLVHISSFCFFV